MKKCNTISIESYEATVTHQASRVILPALMDEMYNRDLSIYDAVEVANKNIITISEVNQLNKKLSYTLNSMISKYDINNIVDRCLLANEFIEKEIDLSILKLEILSTGIDNNRKKKKVVARTLDREKMRTDATIEKLKRIKDTEDFKDFINE